MSYNLATFRAPDLDEEGRVRPAGNVSVSATLYRLLRKQRDGLWFNCINSGINLTSSKGNRELKLLPEDVITGHYRFANGVFCGLLHGTYVQFGDREGTPDSGYNDWLHYRHVNREMANQIVTLGEGRDAWVHDYQLFLLPEMLAEHGIKSSFTLHLPFLLDVPDRFVEYMVAAVKGILPAERISLHRRWYRRNLQKFIGSHMPGYHVDEDAGTITSPSGHITQLVVSPVGTDMGVWRGLLDQSTTLPAEIEAVVKEAQRGKNVFLVVARSDPSKGLPELLRAWDTFQQGYPDAARNCILCVITTPSRRVVQAYLDAEYAIDYACGVLSKRWPGTIVLRKEALSPAQLARLYLASSVLIATTLIDGWGLTPGEFATIQAARNRRGQIVVTPETGCHSRFEEHVLSTNIRDPYAAARTFASALRRVDTWDAGQDMVSIVRLIPSTEAWYEDVCPQEKESPVVIDLESIRHSGAGVT